MYQKVSTDMNFAQREEEVIKFWRDEDVFKKTVKLREGAPAFTWQMIKPQKLRNSR